MCVCVFADECARVCVDVCVCFGVCVCACVCIQVCVSAPVPCFHAVPCFHVALPVYLFYEVHTKIASVMTPTQILLL